MSQRSTPWRRIREIWAELDYAQRRLLEIRTGVPLTARSIRAAEIAELETAFANSDPQPKAHRYPARSPVPAQLSGNSVRRHDRSDFDGHD